MADFDEFRASLSGVTPSLLGDVGAIVNPADDDSSLQTQYAMFRTRPISL